MQEVEKENHSVSVHNTTNENIFVDASECVWKSEKRRTNDTEFIAKIEYVYFFSLSYCSYLNNALDLAASNKIGRKCAQNIPIPEPYECVAISWISMECAVLQEEENEDH